MADRRIGQMADPADGMDATHADRLITDDLAVHLLDRGEACIETYGHRRVILNVGVLSESFHDGERVDVNSLKERYLIPYDTGYLKILAGGVLDKPLLVYADAFSLQAVKMIALTGGHAVRVGTVPLSRPRTRKKRERA
jgi:ribosomal protein L15